LGEARAQREKRRAAGVGWWLADVDRTDNAAKPNTLVARTQTDQSQSMSVHNPLARTLGPKAPPS
jgi:hypothetical protein